MERPFKEEHSEVRGYVEVTHARRRSGPAGLGSGAGRRTARTARTVGPPCCVDSPRTRLRSCCRSSCTRRGRSDTMWSDGCTHTLRRKGTKCWIFGGALLENMTFILFLSTLLNTFTLLNYIFIVYFAHL